MQNEEWECYKAKLEDTIMERLGSTNSIEAIEESCKNRDINDTWDIISSSIISSAYATLPSKKISVCSIPGRKTNENDKISKDLKRLGKVCHKCSSKIGLSTTEEDRQQTNEVLTDLNNKYDLQIAELAEGPWTDETVKDLKS